MATFMLQTFNQEFKLVFFFLGFIDDDEIEVIFLFVFFKKLQK